MRTVNLTIELESLEEISRSKSWLSEHLEIKKFVILPDTNELYDSDINFRHIEKELKKLKKLKNDYINTNN